jgi:molybdopterin/thiamine biosynthesis adenylyltransferase
MQNLINKIQDGELSQKQLITELVKFNEQTIEEYEAACDVVDNNQVEISNLKKQAVTREKNIQTLKDEVLKAVSFAKKFESENIIFKAENKEIKQLRSENKSLKNSKAKAIDRSKNQITRIESLTKDCREYRAKIAVKNSDIARLRLTGAKVIGGYSFTIFPSKVSGGDDKGEKVVLLAHNGTGAFKAVTFDDGEVAQPKSHTFKFNDEQESFIESFDRIAKADKYQFTDRVLAMIN